MAGQALVRIAAGILGGYAFAWGVSAAGIALLVSLGAPFHDAEMAMHMLALLAFLAAFLWSFAAASPLRVWLALGGGAALLLAAAGAIQHAILF